MEKFSKRKAVGPLSLPFFKSSLSSKTLYMMAVWLWVLHHRGLSVSNYFSLTLEKEGALPTTKSKLHLSTCNSPIT